MTHRGLCCRHHRELPPQLCYPFPWSPPGYPRTPIFMGHPVPQLPMEVTCGLSLEIRHCISRGCTNHSSEETRLKIRAGSIYETYLFCLSEAGLHRWTIKHTADRELFSGTHTLISYKYYSRREQNRYCLLMFPLNTATQMVINASWHA